MKLHNIEANGDIQLEFRTMEGRVVKNVTLENASDNLLNIDVSDLPEQIYMLRIQADDFMVTKRIVVQH